MEFGALEKYGPELAKWSAKYLQDLRSRPVRAQTKPGEIATQVPASPPSAPEDFETLFQDFEEMVLPGITHWQHPRFFAYFPANSSPPSILAEWLTATLAAQCMLWQTSPAATELETCMLGWLRQMIGLPEGFHGVIQDSASSATLAAILVARERALNWTGNSAGLAGQSACRIYCSDQVHSSIDKACWIAGIGQENLVKIPTGGALKSLDVNALEEAIVEDKAAGYRPAGLIVCVGATGTGACDEIDQAMDVAERHGLYVHVDAAWAGSAMICPEFRHLMKGAERADSFVFNPHKWLFTNFDCTAHFVRNPESLVKTLGIRPSYLETRGHDGILNYSEWSIPLGRRFRALKLWFVIRSYGVEQLQNMVRNHVLWTAVIAERLAAESDFEIITDPVLSLFTFRYAPHAFEDLDNLNARLVQAINDDGRIYLTQTTVDEKYVVRFAIGQTYTTENDVEMAFNVITEIARGL